MTGGGGQRRSWGSLGAKCVLTALKEVARDGLRPTHEGVRQGGRPRDDDAEDAAIALLERQDGAHLGGVLGKAVRVAHQRLPRVHHLPHLDVVRLVARRPQHLAQVCLGVVVGSKDLEQTARARVPEGDRGASGRVGLAERQVAQQRLGHARRVHVTHGLAVRHVEELLGRVWHHAQAKGFAREARHRVGPAPLVLVQRNVTQRVLQKVVRLLARVRRVRERVALVCQVLAQLRALLLQLSEVGLEAGILSLQRFDVFLDRTALNFRCCLAALH
jgi:hypothetical protein